MYFIAVKSECTFSFQSFPDLYGDLKGFLDRLPADRLELFRQSKNLSNISAKYAVCVALAPTNSVRPFATELLRTWMYQGIGTLMIETSTL